MRMAALTSGLTQRLSQTSLATRTSFATSILFLVAILVVGAISMQSFRSQLLTVIMSEQDTLVDRISDDLEQKLLLLQHMLNTSASEIKEADLADSDAAQRYLDANTGLFAAFDRSVFLFSADARLLAERPFRPNRRGMDASFRPYMKETILRRRPVISEPFQTNVGDANMVLVMTQPVLSRDGHLLGILTGSLGLTRPGMLGNIAKTVVGKSGYLQIVTADGKLIMHPDRKRLSQRAYQLNTNASFERALQGFSGTEESEQPNGRTALVSHSRVPSAQWIVSAVYPKEEALAAVDDLIWRFAQLFVLACVVVLAAVWGLTRYFMRPLVSLTHHLTDYTATDARIAPLNHGGGSGEVHALTSAFDHLTARLHQREDALIEAMQRYQLITENSKDLITKHTTEGVITYASPVAATVLGVPHTELVNRSLFEFVHPEDFDAVQAAFAEASEGRVERTFVFRARHTNQHYLWLEVTLGMMASIAGEATAEVLCISRNISDRKGMEERLYDLARTDHVTGLPNRLLLEERFDSALNRAYREGSMVAALMIDIDRFKKVNDTLGHGTGDTLLQLVASRLSACIREGDTLARWGGDEFVLLLPELKEPGIAGEIASRCLGALKRVFKVDGNVLHISASIGISYSRDMGIQAEAMLKNAHTAMYKAKARGGDCFVTYASEMSAGAQSRLSMENALFHAIERDELRLHYQPLVVAKSGRLAGVEALLRWQHPELGLVPPGHFIPIAEDTGLIGELGEWVLRTACKQMSVWYGQGLPRIPVSVNLSSRQFRKDNLVSTIKSVLDDTGLEPDLLELELTESLLMDDVAHSQAILSELKALGVTVALDDFGTGYSSLSYLKRFPLDTLKIDRSFTMELPGSEANASIVRATIGLAKGLRLRTVAEGVETRAQANFLVEHGCDVLQGYLFSKPMPADDLFKFGTASPTYLVSKKAG
jgi:diguanylate cyclase (GGDEF)-like protein/PAS domain S-box-containing protein